MGEEASRKPRYFPLSKVFPGITRSGKAGQALSSSTGTSGKALEEASDKTALKSFTKGSLYQSIPSF